MKLSYFFSLIFIINIVSCKKLIEIPPPDNQLTDNVVFTDSSDANAAVISLYVRAIQTSTSLNLINGGSTIYTGLASDELMTTSSNQAERQFMTNSIDPLNNNALVSLWNSGFQMLYQANACIEGINNSNTLSVSVKNRLIGEALVFRGLVFLNLVNLYGGVPLITSTDYRVNMVKGRSSVEEVLAQAADDLEIASNLLGEEYSTADKSRPNRFSALSILSRIYLYQERWQKAIDAINLIEDSRKFELEPSVEGIFKITSRESIWQLKPLQAGYNTIEGQMFIPRSGAIPRYTIRKNLIDSFSLNDLRGQNWIRQSSIGGNIYWYPFKYRLNNLSSSYDERYVLIRLAELYLIRAEALCKLGQIDEALEDLNIIRRRAGLLDVEVNNPELLLQYIMNERRLELFCENGHRWIDLKRSGMVSEILGPIKGSDWTESDALFPIPFNELLLNSSLVQNPGY